MRNLPHLLPAMALSALFAAHPVAADEVFEDPSGFFSLLVPTGWTADPQGGGVSLSLGSAWASVWHMEGSGPPEGLTEAIAGNIAQSWQKSGARAPVHAGSLPPRAIVPGSPALMAAAMRQSSASTR